MSHITDQEFRQQIQLHTPLVEKLARNLVRRLPANVDCADLIQDGQIALINAIISNSKKLAAAHFKNYVAMRVQGAMLDGLRVLDHGSRQLRKDMRAVELTIHKLGHQLGRLPREREVAAALDMPLRKYQRILQAAADYTLISLDDIVALDQQILHLANDGCSDPLGVLERASLRDSLALALSMLPEQSSKVLHLYYVEDFTMHQIGESIRLTEARVSQIHAQAIAELRARMVDASGVMPVLKPRRAARTMRPATASA
jgi:RNA polymerase sigma factor for flagellar operon FliA